MDRAPLVVLGACDRDKHPEARKAFSASEFETTPPGTATNQPSKVALPQFVSNHVSDRHALNDVTSASRACELDRAAVSIVSAAFIRMGTRCRIPWS
jgi:hypothetical protein